MEFISVQHTRRLGGGGTAYSWMCMQEAGQHRGWQLAPEPDHYYLNPSTAVYRLASTLCLRHLTCQTSTMTEPTSQCKWDTHVEALEQGQAQSIVQLLLTCAKATGQPVRTPKSKFVFCRSSVVRATVRRPLAAGSGTSDHWAFRWWQIGTSRWDSSEGAQTVPRSGILSDTLPLNILVPSF